MGAQPGALGEAGGQDATSPCRWGPGLWSQEARAPQVSGGELGRAPVPWVCNPQSRASSIAPLWLYSLLSPT